MKIKAKDEQVKTLDNVHLVVSVKVAPIEGKVNDAVIRIIAKNFGIPRNLIRLRNGSASHVLRKCSDFEVKTLKSEQSYRDNLTSLERFSTEIRTFS